MKKRLKRSGPESARSAVSSPLQSAENHSITRYQQRNRKQELLTDKAIKAAIAGMPSSGLASRSLTDPSERGGGRLRLLLRNTESGYVTSKWFVVHHRDGKPVHDKIGNYPAMTLAEARRLFREEYQPAIRRGEDPKWSSGRARRAGLTFGQMCLNYVEKFDNPDSQEQARLVLFGPSGVVATIGANLSAAEITREHVLPVLAAIHQRAPKQAARVRSTLHAAFAYTIKAAGSYHGPGAGVDYGLTYNPISAIERDPTAIQPRDRSLTKSELRAFWRWLEQPRANNKNRAYVVLKLILLTGLRPCEVLALAHKDYDPDESLLYWRKTKNGKPHCLPLGPMGRSTLEALEPSPEGLYFPAKYKIGEPAAVDSLNRLVRSYVSKTGAEPFEVRDLRRTWKTLCGGAGVPLEIRNRLQNHGLNGVGERVYDRYDYMKEKRQAVEVWEGALTAILTDPKAVPVSRFAEDEIDRLEAAIGDRGWRLAAQASHRDDYIGRPLAKALGAAYTKAWKREVPDLVARLVWEEHLVKSTKLDAQRGVQVPAYYWRGREPEAMLTAEPPLKDAGSPPPAQSMMLFELEAGPPSPTRARLGGGKRRKAGSSPPQLKLML